MLLVSCHARLKSLLRVVYSESVWMEKEVEPWIIVVECKEWERERLFNFKRVGIWALKSLLRASNRVRGARSAMERWHVSLHLTWCEQERSYDTSLVGRTPERDCARIMLQQCKPTYERKILKSSAAVYGENRCVFSPV